MKTVKSVSWEEPVLGVYGGDNENVPRIDCNKWKFIKISNGTHLFCSKVHCFFFL